MASSANAMLIAPSKRQDRLQLLTVVYVALALLVLLGAITSDNNMLFWMVGVAIASIAVSGFIAGPAMMGLRLAHTTAPTLTDAGEPLRIGVALENINRRRTIYALRIAVDLIGPQGQTERIRAGLARIGPGQRATAQIEHTANTRGRWELAVVRVSTTFPFGLSNKAVMFRAPRDIYCLPPARPSDDATTLAAGSVEPIPRPRSLERAVGQPYALREYRTGDPRRAIAWKASARAARLMIREDEPTGDRTVWFRPMVSETQLRERDPAGETTLGLLRGLAEAAERSGRPPGLWHPESGTLAPPSIAPGWRVALATLGDKPDPTAARTQSRAAQTHGQAPQSWIPVGGEAAHR